MAGSSVAHEKIESLSDLRKKGSTRKYTFFIDTVKIGELTSEFKGETRFEGYPALRFSGQLNLDYSAVGRPYSMEIKNSRYVDENNRYIGDDMAIIVNNKVDKLYYKNGEEYLEGYTIRNDVEDDIMIPLGRNYAAIDNNMIDQYELLLATYDFKVGDTIHDTVFVPQVTYLSPITCIIENYDWYRYGDYSDSAYLCHFTEPIEINAYFTRDNKLIRLNQPMQKLSVILEESPFKKMAPKVKSFTFSDFLWRLPIYVVYIIFGGFLAIPFIRRRSRKTEIYLALLLGVLLYQVIKVTQIPIQQWYTLKYLLPGLRTGASIYTLAIMPALVTGFIQEILKLIPILIIYFWKKPRQADLIAIGVFCGLGLGVYEACFLTGAPFQNGALGILSWGVWERLFAIVFHVLVGAAFGYALSRGWLHLAIFSVIAILIHALTGYLIVFVQTKALDIALMQIIYALIVLITLLLLYLYIKASRKRAPSR
jgi:hypothetical protein